MAKLKKSFMRRKYIVMLLWVVIFSTIFWPQLVLARTIRVGYYMFDGYQMEDANKVRSGYGYDFLQEMARYTGWDYEYVGYDLGWAKLQEMLERGEIDILTSARLTPEREGKYLFSTQMGTSTGVLNIKSGSSRLTTGDYATYNGIKVGMIKNSSINENFARFAAEKGFSYIPVEYLNADEMSEALQEGAIDAICATSLRRGKNEWTVDQFDAAYFYVMLNKNSVALQQEINAAMEQMNLYSPGWQTTLNNKYYKQNVGEEIAFTAEEQAFVQQCQAKNVVFTAIVDPDNAPYSYFVNGEAKGIIPDIFAEIARRSHLKFNIIATKDRAGYIDVLAHQPIAVQLDSYLNFDLAEKNGYRLTLPYLSTPVAQIGRKQDNNKPQALALLYKGTSAFLINRGFFPDDIKKHYYPSLRQCVEAVVSGEADITLAYPYSAQRYLEEESDAKLRVTLLPNYTVHFALGVAKNTDKSLLTILNKAVASVKQEYTNQAILNNIATKQLPVSMQGFFAKYPWLRNVLAALVAALIIALVLNVIRHRNMRAMAAKNVQLEKAMAEAKQASAAKSNFLSGVSHDMRTPLNGIVGFTNFALATDDPAQRQAYLQKIKQSSNILVDLINDTLEVSRIESGKFTLHQDWYDLPALIAAVSVVIRAAAEQRKLTFTQNLQFTEEKYGWVDHMKLEEVFLNLLSNAVKYTKEGGWVKLKVQQTGIGEHSWLTIEVADNGIGMSKEYLPVMFDPFSQEMRVQLKNTSGTGLGLTIVKRIVDLMQGTITVASCINVGSTFTVKLPIVVKKAPEKELKTQQATAWQLALAGKKILLCEDNSINTEIAKTLLTGKAMQVVCVENGQQGVDAFARSAAKEFAAILMDIHMPVLDGYGATQKIRALSHPQAQTIPIIAMTADAYDEDVKKCLASGMNAHVAKPVNPEALFKILGQVIK